MNLYDISARLSSTDYLVSHMQTAAWALLGCLATASLVFASVRGALLGSLQEPVAWGLRVVLVIVCLSSYDFLTRGLFDASRGLASVFVERSEWSAYWAANAERLQPLMDQPADAVAEESSAFDRLIGVMRGGLLSIVLAVVYWAQFWISEFVAFLAVVVLSILRILGPLMLAAGVLGSGASLRQWFSSMLQACLWPVFPPFCLMIVSDARFRAAAGDNVAFELAQGLTLTLLCLGTPVVVMFLMGRGGVSAAAGAMTGTAASAATHLATLGLGLAGVGLARAAGGSAAAGQMGPGGAGSSTPWMRPGSAATLEASRAAARPHGVRRARAMVHQAAEAMTRVADAQRRFDAGVEESREPERTKVARPRLVPSPSSRA